MFIEVQPNDISPHIGRFSFILYLRRTPTRKNHVRVGVLQTQFFVSGMVVRHRPNKKNAAEITMLDYVELLAELEALEMRQVGI